MTSGNARGREREESCLCVPTFKEHVGDLKTLFLVKAPGFCIQRLCCWFSPRRRIFLYIEEENQEDAHINLNFLGILPHCLTAHSVLCKSTGIRSTEILSQVQTDPALSYCISCDADPLQIYGRKMGQYLLFNITDIGRTLEAAGDGEISDPAINETRLLLMPAWAYQSAAAYLIFISIFGLFLNFFVFFVIITDQQVGRQFLMFVFYISTIGKVLR